MKVSKRKLLFLLEMSAWVIIVVGWSYILSGCARKCPDPVTQILHTENCLDGLPLHLKLKPGDNVTLKAGTGVVSFDVRSASMLKLTAKNPGWNVEVVAYGLDIKYKIISDTWYEVFVRDVNLVRVLGDKEQDVLIQVIK